MSPALLIGHKKKDNKKEEDFCVFMTRLEERKKIHPAPYSHYFKFHKNIFFFYVNVVKKVKRPFLLCVFLCVKILCKREIRVPPLRHMRFALSYRNYVL